MLSKPRRSEPTFSNVDRLAGFSDGVIAIAITILVLGLEVPSAHKVPEKALGDYLIDSIHPAIGFVVSFVLIGTYWLGHYSIFHLVTHVTRTFVALNGLFLLCLSFLPFPTGLQATYREDELAMVLYGVAQLLCGLSLLALWLYAIADRRLVRPNLSPALLRNTTRRLMIAPGLCILAIGCSFISILFSRVILLLIPCFFLWFPIVDSDSLEAATSRGD